MPTPYNDRWERTKRYLLRNFLVNPGFQLSPIPEEDRSSDSGDSGTLPDLVVEREPDRHDDPPDFYDGLERRARRLYHRLFLRSNGSDDDDTSDFEVNQSMTSTLILDDNTRRYNSKNILTEYNNRDSDPDISAEERILTKSSIETDDDEVTEAQDRDKLIETCATYNETGQATDDSGKSSIEDEDSIILIQSHSVHEPNQSNDFDTGPNISTEANYDFSYEGANQRNYDNQSSLTIAHRSKPSYISGRKQTLSNEDVEIIEAKSDSEDSPPCHRISTTCAEVHEAKRRRASTPQFDNGSPVLVPRLLQFSRIVFGSGGRHFGQSFNVLEASDEFIKRLSHKHDEAKGNGIEEQEIASRLITTSEITRARLDFSTRVAQCLETNDTQEDIDNEHENKQPGDDIPDQTDSDLEKNFINERNLSEHKNDDVVGEYETELYNKTTESNGARASTDWEKTSIDNDENWFDNAIRKGIFVSKAIEKQQDNKIDVLSSDEEIGNTGPIAHSSEKSINDEEIEVMRDARVSQGNVSWHGEAGQRSISSAFEAENRFSDADKSENESTASPEINATYEEIKDTNEIPQNAGISQKMAEFIDDFWSVSSVDLDFAELPKDRSRRTDSGSGLHKRKTDSENESNRGATVSEHKSKVREEDSKNGSNKRESSESELNKRQKRSEIVSTRRESELGSGSKMRTSGSESGSDNREYSDTGSNKRQRDSEKASTTGETGSGSGSKDRTVGSKSESDKRTYTENGSTRRGSGSGSEAKKRKAGSKSGSDQRKSSGSGSDKRQRDLEYGSITGGIKSGSWTKERKADRKSGSDRRKFSDVGLNKKNTDSDRDSDSGSESSDRIIHSVRSSYKRKPTECGNIKRKSPESHSKSSKSSGSGSIRRKTSGSGYITENPSKSNSNTEKTSSGSIKRKSPESGDDNIQTDSETGSTKSNISETGTNIIQTDSDEVPSLKRRKNDIAIQTGSHENQRDWEDVKNDFFVGTPLMLRLCNCPDHVCP